MDYDEICNLRIIGDTSVGKTSLLMRFKSDEFSYNLTTTIGIDSYTKDEFINNKKVRIKIWDTAGQERYRSLTSSFFRNAQGIILCYDITNRITFSNLKEWIESLKKGISDLDNIKVIVVGNKNDLHTKREVPFEEAEKFCKENLLPLYETSAKEGTNVRSTIIKLVEKIYNDTPQFNILNRDSVTLRASNHTKFETPIKKCC